MLIMYKRINLNWLRYCSKNLQYYNQNKLFCCNKIAEYQKVQDYKTNVKDNDLLYTKLILP